MVSITNVIVHNLSGGQDACEEFVSSYNIDLLLQNSVHFSVAGVEYVVDRVKMTSEDYSDEVKLYFANESKVFTGLDIPREYLLEIYNRVRSEQESGLLKGWAFDEDISDMVDSAEQTNL